MRNGLATRRATSRCSWSQSREHDRSANNCTRFFRVPDSRFFSFPPVTFLSPEMRRARQLSTRTSGPPFCRPTRPLAGQEEVRCDSCLRGSPARANEEYTIGSSYRCEFWKFDIGTTFRTRTLIAQLFNIRRTTFCCLLDVAQRLRSFLNGHDLSSVALCNRIISADLCAIQRCRPDRM